MFLQHGGSSGGDGDGDDGDGGKILIKIDSKITCSLKIPI